MFDIDRCRVGDGANDTKPIGLSGPSLAATVVIEAIPSFAAPRGRGPIGGRTTIPFEPTLVVAIQRAGVGIAQQRTAMQETSPDPSRLGAG